LSQHEPIRRKLNSVTLEGEAESASVINFAGARTLLPCG
jgi:hypothetical protein